MSREWSRPTRERELARLAAQLGKDELDALVLLARRALVGQTHYGRLNIVRDPRDFPTEALEEVVDGMFYAAAGLLRQRARGRLHRAGGHGRRD